jgi:hypothetical protein
MRVGVSFFSGLLLICPPCWGERTVAENAVCRLEKKFEEKAFLVSSGGDNSACKWRHRTEL